MSEQNLSPLQMIVGQIQAQLTYGRSLFQQGIRNAINNLAPLPPYPSISGLDTPEVIVKIGTAQDHVFGVRPDVLLVAVTCPLEGHVVHASLIKALDQLFQGCSAFDNQFGGRTYTVTAQAGELEGQYAGMLMQALEAQRQLRSNNMPVS